MNEMIPIHSPTLYPHPPLSHGSHQATAAMVALLALALLTAALATSTSGSHITATQIISASIFFLSAGRLLFVFYKEKVLDPEKKMVEYALGVMRVDATGMSDPMQYLKLTKDLHTITDPTQLLKITYAICCLELRRLPGELKGWYTGWRERQIKDGATRLPQPLFADVFHGTLVHLDRFFTCYHQLKSQGKVTPDLLHLHNDLIDKFNSWFCTSEEQSRLDDMFRQSRDPWRRWLQLDDQR